MTDVPDTRIGYVAPGSPAEKAGILPGDVIRKIDGEDVSKWMGNMEGVKEKIALSEHELITLTVERAKADGSTEMLDIRTGFDQPETKWWQRSSMRQVGIAQANISMVHMVVPNSPAARAGLKEGQQVTHLNGQAIHTSVVLYEAAKKGTPMALTLKNPDGSVVETTLTPVIPENWEGKEGAHPLAGAVWGAPKAEFNYEYPTPWQQVGQSLRWMGITLDKVIAPNSSVGMEHMSGPVGIGSHMYDMMQLPGEIGWRLLLWFAVILNVNLAVLNILPLPVVDGGHVTLGIIEMIKGKPVSGAFLNRIMVGFIFLLLFFFVYVTFKDVGDMVGKGNELPEPVFNLPAQP